MSPVIDLLDITQMTDIHLLDFILYFCWIILWCGSGVVVNVILERSSSPRSLRLWSTGHISFAGYWRESKGI